MLDREKVGNAIAAQRKRKGMTQRHLADMLNVSYQAVSRWEQGSSLPSVDMIYDIAQTLDTTVDFLLNGLSKERKTLTYLDTGLDTKKLYMIKTRLDKLITNDAHLLYAEHTDPVFFQLDTTHMTEPVYVSANHVPGSKERFAMENGYDREICMDLVASAANNLIQFGVKPAILQVNILCGNNDSGQLLTMGEAFKKTCEDNGILFAGMEVSGQAINYRPDEYKLNASVIGVVDKSKIVTGDDITQGDIIIGIKSDGIYATSYPFVRLILDKDPTIAYGKIDQKHTFMDAFMEPNAVYVSVVSELLDKGLVHGILNICNSILKCKAYHTIPEGLGACISLPSIPILPLFRYLYDLKMMDTETFLRYFSFGIGMLVIVPKAQCETAVKVIEKYHPCHIIGTIEKNDAYPDEKVWTEGKIKW